MPLGFPVIVIGGIYDGLFSPTEAAAMSVLYALVLELLVFHAVKVREAHRPTGQRYKTSKSVVAAHIRAERDASAHTRTCGSRPGRLTRSS